MKLEPRRLDGIVSRRAAARKAQRRAAALSMTVVKALGANSKLWFAYEEAREALAIAREAAAYDAGVQDGLAIAITETSGSSHEVTRPRLAHRALSPGLAQKEAASAKGEGPGGRGRARVGALPGAAPRAS